MQARNPGTETPSEGPFTLEHPQVIAALEEYMEALQTGKATNRQAFLDRFPEIAAELKDCLHGLELLQGSADVRRPATGIREGMPAPLPGRIGDDLAAVPLGDFRLLREIGRGGMGVVYEAEQLSLGRRVALKVLPFAATLDPRQLQRFKHEAQAAACLHHPNIVPVYAVGCERGVHYYAMQFIEGQTVAVAVRQLRQQRGLPVDSEEPSEHEAATHPNGKSISSVNGSSERAAGETYLSKVTEGSRKDSEFFRHAAELALRVADALEHAHQFGVVHRDIKPANLLVDHQGQVWITDFGLARLETNASITMTGDLVGTLRYMSPEQAMARRGAIDHRTDIYSLGITLYELLTLQPAFDGNDRHEVLRKIAAEEPRRPRQIHKAIPPDLETIILKATAKNPDERYASAQELAGDLRCFLDDKPIQARRPSLVTRLSKWSRRHRSLVASGLVLMVLATIGLAISNYRIYNEQKNTQAALNAAETQRKLTEQALAAEAKQRKLTQQNFEQARRVLGVVTQVTIEDLVGSADVQAVRRKLLEMSLNYYRNFIEKAADNPALQRELSTSHFRVATILETMGKEEEAQRILRLAFDLQEPLRKKNPFDRELQSSFQTMFHWSMMKSGGKISSKIRLLDEPSVQAELKLSADQIAAVTGLVEKQRSFFSKAPEQPLRDRSVDALVSEFDTLSASLAESVDRTLMPKQLKRLDQIRLQTRGVYAFKDSEVAAKLQLTDAQQESIGRLVESYKQLNWPRGPSSEVRQGATAAILTLLTDEQKQTWMQMTGKTFTGEIRYGMPGRPGVGTATRP